MTNQYPHRNAKLLKYRIAALSEDWNHENPNTTEARKGCNKISHHGSLWNHETMYASKHVHTLFFFLHSDYPHNTCFTYAVVPSIFMLLAFIIQGAAVPYLLFWYLIAVVISIFCCFALHVDSDVCSGYVCWKSEKWVQQIKRLLPEATV